MHVCFGSVAAAPRRQPPAAVHTHNDEHLVYELVERVLAVGAGFAKVDLSRLQAEAQSSLPFNLIDGKAGCCFGATVHSLPQ